MHGARATGAGDLAVGASSRRNRLDRLGQPGGVLVQRDALAGSTTLRRLGTLLGAATRHWSRRPPASEGELVTRIVRRTSLTRVAIRTCGRNSCVGARGLADKPHGVQTNQSSSEPAIVAPTAGSSGCRSRSVVRARVAPPRSPTRRRLGAMRLRAGVGRPRERRPSAAARKRRVEDSRATARETSLRCTTAARSLVSRSQRRREAASPRRTRRRPASMSLAGHVGHGAWISTRCAARTPETARLAAQCVRRRIAAALEPHASGRSPCSSGPCAAAAGCDTARRRFRPADRPRPGAHSATGR